MDEGKRMMMLGGFFSTSRIRRQDHEHGCQTRSPSHIVWCRRCETWFLFLFGGFKTGQGWVQIDEMKMGGDEVEGG